MAVSLRHRLWQATVWITNRILPNNSLSFSFCERTLKLAAKGYDDTTNPSFLAPPLRSTRPTLLKIPFATDRMSLFGWPETYNCLAQTFRRMKFCCCVSLFPRSNATNVATSLSFDWSIHLIVNSNPTSRNFVLSLRFQGTDICNHCDPTNQVLYHHWILILPNFR